MLTHSFTVTPLTHKNASSDTLAAIGNLFDSATLAKFPGALNDGFTNKEPLLHFVASAHGHVVGHVAIVEVSSLPLVYALSDLVLDRTYDYQGIEALLVDSALTTQSELPEPDFWLTAPKKRSVIEYLTTHGFSHVDLGIVTTIDGLYNPDWFLHPLPEPEAETLLIATDC